MSCRNNAYREFRYGLATHKPSRGFSLDTMQSLLNKKSREAPRAKFSEQDYACIKRWFMSLEKSWRGDGVPTSVLSEALLARGIFTSRRQANNMINSIDTDRSGVMSYEEFMAAVNGSNLMHASRLCKFLRCLVQEFSETDDSQLPDNCEQCISRHLFDIKSRDRTISMMDVDVKNDTRIPIFRHHSA